MKHTATRLCMFAVEAIALTCFGMAAHAAAPDVASIQPVKGLVLTSTTCCAWEVVGNNVRSYSGMDFENWDSVVNAGADVIDYQIRLSAPTNAGANADLAKYVLHRSVRRGDIAQATRISLLCSSLDPEMFAGQTFMETSVKALKQLRSGADVPYVIGVCDSEDPLGGIGALMQHAAMQPAGGKPGTTPLAGMASLLATNVAHTYYRGSLHRVEPAPVLLPVLLNGVQVNLPALHAQGTLVNGGKSIPVQFWWLDSPTWPLALKWSLTRGGRISMSQQITKIDLPPANGAGGTGAASAMARTLQTACRLELSGIYFNTGSALLLPESQPALRQIAQVVRQSGMPVLEVQGHTDNIGTAAFNQQLSQQRADAGYARRSYRSSESQPGN